MVDQPKLKEAAERMFVTRDQAAASLEQIASKVEQAEKPTDLRAATDATAAVVAALQQGLSDVPSLGDLAAGTRHAADANETDEWLHAVELDSARVRTLADQVHDPNVPETDRHSLATGIVELHQRLTNIPILRPWPND